MAKISSEKIESIKKQSVDEINKQSIPVAYSQIIDYSFKRFFLENDFKPLVYQGFLPKIFQLISQKKILNKTEKLEEDIVFDEIWHDNCDSSEIANRYIESALNFNYFWKRKLYFDLQNIFWNEKSNQEDVFNYWKNNYPETELSLKCNIIPRTKLWMEKIFQELETEGKPVGVFVGIAHVAGDEGIISIIENKNVYKIIKIKSLKEKGDGSK